MKAAENKDVSKGVKAGKRRKAALQEYLQREIIDLSIRRSEEKLLAVPSLFYGRVLRGELSYDAQGMTLCLGQEQLSLAYSQLARAEVSVVFCRIASKVLPQMEAYLDVYLTGKANDSYEFHTQYYREMGEWMTAMKQAGVLVRDIDGVLAWMENPYLRNADIAHRLWERRDGIGGQYGAANPKEDIKREG